VQGFIDLGNDNVERKAPWMNDIADAVTKKPAEWLYNHGIKLF
jgi:lauroyl/myristoyl acyltransferase